MRAAIQAQKRRKTIDAGVGARASSRRNSPRSRTSSTPSSGTTISTASKRDDVASSPASPKARIRSDCENNKRDERQRPPSACVSTQAGPTTKSALRKAAYLSSPAISRSRAAKVSCMRVGEADHHDQRRHHVQEHVEAEIEPAERAEREQDGDERRRRRDDHERDAAEEQDGDAGSRRRSRSRCRGGGRARPRCGFRAASPARRKARS